MGKGRFIELGQSRAGTVAIITPGDSKRWEFCRIQNGPLDGRVYRHPLCLVEYILRNSYRPEESQEDFTATEERVIDSHRVIIKDILRCYKRYAISITDEIEEVLSYEEGKIFHFDSMDFLDFIWSLFIVHFLETLKFIHGDLEELDD